MKKRCFFIGHRDADETMEQALKDHITDLIENKEVGEFLVGKYGNFDRMAAKTVIQLKEKYPHIRLTLLCPYHPALKRINCPDGFDGILYPFEESVFPRFAIVRANRKAICMCEYLIACVNHPGNAEDYLAYASSRERRGLIHTINIGSMAERQSP